MLEISDSKLSFEPKFFEYERFNISFLIDRFSALSSTLFYFSNPALDFEVLSFGERYSISSKDFEAKNIYNLLFNKIDLIPQDDLFSNLPLFFGYHKFPSLIKNQLWSDFQVSEWILPEYIIYRKNDKCFLLDNSIEGNELNISSLLNNLNDKVKKQSSNSVKLKIVSSDSFHHWQKKVEYAINKIKSKELQKIVLSRKKEFEIFGKVNFSYLLEILNNDYKDCFNFLIKSNDSYFFGSSPELLLKVNGTEFSSEALAGSIQRGSSDYEDENLSQLLLIDKKNRAEHQLVIDYLKSKLSDKIYDFNFELKPKIKKLKNIQHLHTEISGKIKSDSNYFDLMFSIFPTPAVCGIPLEKSISSINDLEELERGLFTGLIGWLNFNKQAEFYVAIRCGLIKNNTLTAFAGCGIVESSNALDEFNETELKLKTITDLFDVESQ